jgi:hypothetical protein
MNKLSIAATVVACLHAGAAWAWGVGCQADTCSAVQRMGEQNLLALQRRVDGGCNLIVVHPSWRLVYPAEEKVFVLIDGAIYEDDEARRFREESDKVLGRKTPAGLTTAGGLIDAVLVSVGCGALPALRKGKRLTIQTRYEDLEYPLAGSAEAIDRLEAEVARRAERAAGWPRVE